MGWTAPRTWVAGEVITKAMLDEQIRDNELAMFSSGVHAVSMIPLPVEPLTAASASIALPANDDLAHLGVITVPLSITVKSLQYYVSAGGGATTAIRIAIYTEDGATKVIDVVDACGACAASIRTVDVVPDTVLTPGNYIVWIGHSVYSTSAKSVIRFTYDVTFNPHVANEPDLSGTLTIAGGLGAAPATIDIDAFTSVAGALIPEVRLIGAA